MNKIRSNLKSTLIETPLGSMMAVGDETALYFLNFVEQKDGSSKTTFSSCLDQESIEPGSSSSLISIEKELSLFFSGTLKNFETPIVYLGTDFQISVWEALRKIPLGQTCSYSELALAVKKETGCRAVARANSTNKLAVIVPCHRVINKNGSLGGYAGGLNRKQWLLKHEKTLFW